MNSSKDKLELIKKASTGDKNAIIDLIKLEQKNIYGMLFYLKKDEIDLADIMQNVLIKLSKNIVKLKNPLSFKTWLNQIILNSYYDYLRKKQRSKIYSPLSDEEFEKYSQIPDTTSNPQESLLSFELDEVIKKSISNLPNHYKIPITLREIQGLSYDEISDITKTTIGTVKSRIARARAIVQENIKKYTRG